MIQIIAPTSNFIFCEIFFFFFIKQKQKKIKQKLNLQIMWIIYFLFYYQYLFPFPKIYTSPLNIYTVLQATFNLLFANVLVTNKSPIFVAFVEDNATMSSIRYFENHVSYFVQNQWKQTLLNSFLRDK